MEKTPHPNRTSRGLVIGGVALGAALGAFAPAFADPPVAPRGAAVARQAPPRALGRAMTNDNGAPVAEIRESQTAGPNGPVLLQDWNLIQRLARFDRERIPERVVHARGAGAFGTFESIGDQSALTRAAFLSRPGIVTPVAVRFSTVIHGSGSPETLRDPRGFAVKFYTQEGNYDLVGNHLPVFFIRDSIRFPDMVHSLKPSPATNTQDVNRIFAFMSETPESTQMLTFLFSNYGTPATYREMHGFGVHAFVWVNAQGERAYVRYKWTSAQGQRNLTPAEAATTQGRDFQHATTDLYAAIGARRFPSWDLSVQVLLPDQLDDFDFNPLDPTRVWPEDRIPLRRIGRMTLNRVPTNFFVEVEQLAFSPGVLVPGIEPSEDQLLQGRLFSYADTQRYRLGANYLDIDVNRPLIAAVNYNQDGAFSRVRHADTNFFPNSGADETVRVDPSRPASSTAVSGNTVQLPNGRGSDFAQAGVLFRSFSDAEKTDLINTLGDALASTRNRTVRLRMLSHFFKADESYGARLAAKAGIPVEEVRRAAAALAN